jgi:uncharacterized protein YbjQ (UPF0145 family)
MRTFRITIPAGYGPGNVFSLTIAGKQRMVKIPPREQLTPEDIKEGTFTLYMEDEDDAVSKIIASTLPTVPGMEIVESRPIIWGSVSHTFPAGSYNQQSMGKVVGSLLQDAQRQILEETVKANCNAVLGMSFNITNDSSGENGRQKLVIVTACGTPCTVMSMASPPVVQAEAIVIPLNNIS